MDTQWPRYQVFLQEKPGAPHQDVGSVHAPDPELALQNARDVFVRRPDCVSLWVVPAEAIFSKTAEELETWQPQSEQVQKTTEPDMYLVFCKEKAAGTQTQIGEVQAASPVQALSLALKQFSFPRPPFAWWVFPARLVVQSSPEDVLSMFAPALDKPFRLSDDFHVVSAMRKLKSREKPATGRS